jgi:hypothetical protein
MNTTNRAEAIRAEINELAIVLATTRRSATSQWYTDRLNAIEMLEESLNNLED